MRGLYKKPDGRRREFKASQGTRETRRKNGNASTSAGQASAGSSSAGPSGTSPHLMNLEWTDTVEPSVTRRHRSTKTKLPVYSSQHPSSDPPQFHNDNADSALESDWDWAAEDGHHSQPTEYPEGCEEGAQGVVEEDEDDEDLWVDIEADGVSQWDANKHDALDEMVRVRGRGEHTNQEKCHTCNNNSPTFRCTSCFTNGVLYCQSCICLTHNAEPFHFLEVSALIPQSCTKSESNAGMGAIERLFPAMHSLFARSSCAAWA
jgi:hypothetical protein